MLMLRGTVPFVRPGPCWDLEKQCEKSVSVLRCKLGCSAVYNSVEKFFTILGEASRGVSYVYDLWAQYGEDVERRQ